jgi:putative peptide zinc metalloprotease protein
MMTIDQASRLAFLPLSVVADGDEFLVGHAESGTFLAMPEIGVWLLRELEGGLTVGEATAKATLQGLDLDVADFAATLVAAGLAGTAAAPAVPPPHEGGLALRTAARWAAPLFSWPAWVLYTTALIGSILLLAVRPRYWPVMTDLFFHPSTGLSLAVMGLLSWVLSGMHELFHGLAGRVAGVPVRFRLGRRLFFPVLETDLSGVWALERRRRYGPFCAGMAWDSLVLATCLALRLLADSGLVRLPVPGLPAAVALLAVISLGWQFLIFLRTDLYAVMVNLLGCRNLYRVTYLQWQGRLGRLTSLERAELAGAAAQDLRVARWFGWLYLVGVAWATLFFVRYLIPGLWVTARWVGSSLLSRAPTALEFWLALFVGLLTLVQAVWPVWLWLRQRG